MDVYVTRDDQCFVWNSDKASSNQIKHGLTFEQGIDIFSDPFAIFEDAGVEEERRFAAIGQDSRRVVLYVVHLVREDDCLRIISVRLATGSERKRYEELS